MTTTTKYHACNLCEAICGLKFTFENDQIISIKGDPDDVFSQGHICPKAIALQDIYKDPDRLKKPIKKTANGWQEISWNQAFDEIHNKISVLQNQYGNDSVAVYQGNPVVHNLEAMLFGPRFFKSLKTKNHYSATSVDQLPEQLVSLKLFGHSLMVPLPDVDRTDFIIIIGANPVVSNGSLMTAPGIKKRLQKIQKRQGKVIVIDPRKTETANLADQHLFIKPGNDAFLLLSMLHVLFDNNWVNLKSTQRYCDNLETIESMVKPFSPQAVEEMTGVDPTIVIELVKNFCAANKACCYGRIGVSTHEFGTLTQWLIVIFNILTGHLDHEGGIMFSLPAFDFMNRNQHRTSSPSKRKTRTGFADAHSRVRNLPNFNGEFPVATLAEEILTQGEGQIRALITHCGNPILSTPNGNQLETALKQLDFCVAIDFYVNETTQYADIILPPPSALERPHYDIIFYTLAIRNSTRFSDPLFPISKGSLSDTEIFLNLARRFKAKTIMQKIMGWFEMKLLSKFGVALAINQQFKKGPYSNSQKLSVKKLRQHPHGIDLGAMKPCLPERLFNENKRINLAPAIFVDDIQRLKQKQQNASKDKFDLLLIGRRDPRTNNSWLHNSFRMVKGKNRCVALINPKDANDKQINEGSLVQVQSRVGQIEIEAHITDEIMQGVISIPHGWGHKGDAVNLSVAKAHAGVNINILTDEQFLDKVSGNTALNGVPVTLSSPNI